MRGKECWRAAGVRAAMVKVLPILPYRRYLDWSDCRVNCLGFYRPGPLRASGMSKKSGGSRSLLIPCLIDRIVQARTAALKNLLYSSADASTSLVGL